MKGVIDFIDVRAIPGTDEWELLDSFDWYGITVPKGFVTDFASIPRLMRWWLNPVGVIKPAALVHDYLYHLRGKVPTLNMKVRKMKFRVHYADLFKNGHAKIDGGVFKLTRKGADLIFLRIMERIGYSYLKRQAAYRGVRLGGWMFWNKK